ncbi:hypothetical protein CEXT_453011 [Caerostris extrusa]|uniref:Uncharacterized protein n=1 Tax=Caerostris extrusa TaxID=172846 RepID=A0AAV4N1E2_CAEEX|nr:hypothetical protein CEXT_453011 [Caerostris extrusa]
MRGNHCFPDKLSLAETVQLEAVHDDLHAGPHRCTDPDRLAFSGPPAPKTGDFPLEDPENLEDIKNRTPTGTLTITEEEISQRNTIIGGMLPFVNSPGTQ